MNLDAIVDSFNALNSACQNISDQFYFSAIRPGLSGALPFFIGGYFWRGPQGGLLMAFIGILFTTFFLTVVPELAAEYL